MARQQEVSQNRCMSERTIIEMSEREAYLIVPLLLVAVLMTLPASAQSLSLSEAIERAKAGNPDVPAAAAAEREAAERVTEARGGHLPKVDVSESWQRGNNPRSCSARCWRSGGSPPATLHLMRSITPMPQTTSARRSPFSSRSSTAPFRRTSEPRRSAGTWQPRADNWSIRI
jgi:hypothetical protein